MKSKKISNSMKNFWKEKGDSFLKNANKKRSNTLKNSCVWLKKENGKPFPCNIELVLSKLSEGYLLVNTEKNRNKIFKTFGEIPDFFWANKNK